MVVSAKVVKNEVSSQLFNLPIPVFVKIIVLGLIIGLLTWLLALALDKYMLTPFFCNSGENIAICTNSTVMASNIATVLMGIMAVPILATIQSRRALLVVIAAVASLWGISAWVAGEWLNSLIWTMALFAAVYASLTWLNRLRNTVVVLILFVVFVILARLVLVLA